MIETTAACAQAPAMSLTESALNDLQIQLVELSAEVDCLQDLLFYVLRPAAPASEGKSGLSDVPIMSPAVERLYNMTRGTVGIRQHLAEIVDRLEV